MSPKGFLLASLERQSCILLKVGIVSDHNDATLWTLYSDAMTVFFWLSFLK